MKLLTPRLCPTSSPESRSRTSRGRWSRRGLMVPFVAAALVLAGGASTAMAADGGSTIAGAIDESAPTTSAVRVELGRGMVGTIDTQRGTMLVESPGGILPVWDSALLGVDRYDLGSAWTWGTPFVTAVGPLRVSLPGLGRFDADASKPSGLAGYAGDDLVFSAQGGRLPARGEVPEREYASQIRYVLGATSYFDGRGDLITTIGADGAREDRVYRRISEQRTDVRLERVIGADGAVTTVDSSHSPSIRIVSAATGVETSFSTSAYTAYIGSTTPSDGGFAWSDFSKAPSGEYSTIRSNDHHARSTTATLTWDASRPGRVTGITRDGVRLYQAAQD